MKKREMFELSLKRWENNYLSAIGRKAKHIECPFCEQCLFNCTKCIPMQYTEKRCNEYQSPWSEYTSPGLYETTKEEAAINIWMLLNLIALSEGIVIY